MLKGIALSVGAGVAYAALLVGTLLVHASWLQIAVALAMGFQTSVLFVLAHDACHGSLTPSARLNRLIATLFFLPAWHPYSSWKYTHNGLHHGWTNVRGKEVVYVPFSKEEYDALPRWRQLAERLFRTPPGLCIFYLCTVFPLHELFPTRERAPKGGHYVAFQWERILVFCFIAAISGLAIAAAQWQDRSVLLSLVMVVVVPTVFHFAIFGTVTFLHHTHPRAPWFDESDFEYFDILRSTVHLELPRPIEWTMMAILRHTAHHADTRIPLYNLKQSQSALERTFDEVIHEPFTIAGYLRTMRTCRLFDYEQHRWLDWDGTPTTGPLVVGRVAGTAAAERLVEVGRS